MEDFVNEQMLTVGTLLKGGEYRVMRHIGSGGFGNTYEVEHTRLGKRMAMKEFFMRGINQREGTTVTVSVAENKPTFEQMREKFYKEAQRLARLEDLHIVSVNDFFEENGTVYYVMALIDGLSLAAVMKQQGKTFTEQEVRRILPQILAALRCVHRQSLFHLDIKPGNILQNADGHCWLIDFGASKQMSTAESQTLSTSTGLCYTPGYAPTEQISGNVKRIGPWTDFYALGATVYHLLTGHVPPSPDDVFNDDAEAFDFPSDISAGLREVIVWLMQPRPKDRPQSVDEIGERLKVPSPVTPTPVMTERKPSDDTIAAKPQTSEALLHDEKRPKVEKKQEEIAAEEKEPDAEPPSDIEPATAAAVRQIVDNMVEVMGGTFKMGREKQGFFSFLSTNDDQCHWVTLSSSFSIGKYPVTQKEWEAVMGYNHSACPGADRPVTNVSREEVMAFIGKLNRLTGLHFRLPTEAEWEYAARGGRKSKGYQYAGSDDLDEVGWYDVGEAGSYSVGKKAPNELGLYDMSGNVWEMCQDYYGPYDEEDAVDPKGDAYSDFYVQRGGCWINSEQECRVYYRGVGDGDAQSTLGFRLAF